MFIVRILKSTARTIQEFRSQMDKMAIVWDNCGY